MTTLQYSYSPKQLKHDYICHDHQCLASECGCLDELLRKICPVHEVEMVSTAMGMYCPYCEFPGWGD